MSAAPAAPAWTGPASDPAGQPPGPAGLPGKAGDGEFLATARRISRGASGRPAQAGSREAARPVARDLVTARAGGRTGRRARAAPHPARVGIQEAARTLPGPGRALRAAAAVFCLAAGTAGCASGTTGSQPPARTGPAPSAPGSPAQSGDPRALARAAYLGMWQAYVAAARTADYQAPGLDHHAAGGALTTLTQGLYQEHQDGDVSLGQPKLNPAVTLVKGSGGDVTQADVTDCADGSHWLNYHDGKPIAAQDLRRRYIIARLQPFNGTWKVTYLNVGKAGTC